jgi:hypothetical protein
MSEILDPVSEVREWRRQVMESWKGKSREEIRRELNELGERFKKEMEEERTRKKAGAA